MSRFSNLQSAFDKSHTEAFNYRMNCGGYVLRFAEGLRSYLDAPERYAKRRLPSGEITYGRYVTVSEVTKTSSGDLEYKELPENHLIAELIPDERGRWLSGVRVVLDKNSSTWPKHGFVFPINFVIRDDICTMHVGDEREGREFKFSVSDPTGAHVAYEYMYEWLDQVLAKRPWDVPQRMPIGFIQREDQ